ncbi:MAG: PGDYG domain-containing protein [Candidatus Thiodiazotropha weberae]|nr:PGDYG domain-containing protein [Candidatus Thiodiazotropha weberae]
MPMFRKKPIVVEASQWFKNGDHPEDGTETFEDGEFKGELLEGKVVRYYRTPDFDGQDECKHCQNIMHNHGWIDTFEGGHIVCPGDWIITGVKGERYPCKPDIFEDTYELVK